LSSYSALHEFDDYEFSTVTTAFPKLFDACVPALTIFKSRSDIVEEFLERILRRSIFVSDFNVTYCLTCTASCGKVSFFTKCSEFISNFTELFSSFFSCCNAFTHDKGCSQIAQHRFSLIRRTSEFSVAH